MTTKPTKKQKVSKELLTEHYRDMQKKSWASKKTDHSRERFQKMQALSALSRKQKKAQTDLSTSSTL